jgi:hypothetical protein
VLAALGNWEDQQMLCTRLRYRCSARSVVAIVTAVAGGVGMLSPLGPASAAFGQQASLTPLGDLPGGRFDSEANGIGISAADGPVAAGVTNVATPPGDPSPFPDTSEAFRWTRAGGMQGLGDLPGGQYLSLAHGVSGDGTAVVGYSAADNAIFAFRWTAATGMQSLGAQRLHPGSLRRRPPRARRPRRPRRRPALPRRAAPPPSAAEQSVTPDPTRARRAIAPKIAGPSPEAAGRGPGSRCGRAFG